MRRIFATILSLMVLGLFIPHALAHVVVKPAEVGAGAFQTFTVGVPNEKDNPTVNVRLVIPEGLRHVSATVKPGWKIEVKKTGEGEEAVITEIEWKEGTIPAGMRDDFTFSAQAPAEEKTIQWKAYQKYQDGEVVAWDQAPSSSSDHESKPYSETSVVNDLQNNDSNTDWPLIIAIIALLLSLYTTSRVVQRDR